MKLGPGDEAARRARAQDARYDRIANPRNETSILVAIHDAIALTGKCLLWRNNTGMARFGGARVRYGLGLGGADLVGVLRPRGRGFALEVKTAVGTLSAEQRAWHRAWAEAGGFVACVRSVDEALAALARAIEEQA